MMFPDNPVGKDCSTSPRNIKPSDSISVSFLIYQINTEATVHLFYWTKTPYIARFNFGLQHINQTDQSG